MRWTAIAVGAVITFAPAATAAAAESDAPPPDLGPQIEGPVDSDQLRAALVGGKNIWMFVTTEKSGPLQAVQAFKLDGRRWREGSGLPQASSDWPVAGGESGAQGRPCVGYSVPGGPMVQCLIDGRFQRPKNHALLADLGRLVDVRGSGSEVHVLFKRRAGREVELSVARIDRRGRVIAITPAASTPDGFATLSISSEGDPAILIQELAAAQARYILEFDGVAWQAATPRLEGEGFGPSAGAGLIDGQDATLAANDANARPWEFSVFGTSGGEAWENLEPPSLSRGRGNAQGQIVSEDWAMWQESRQTPQGFDTKIKAVKRQADGSYGRPAELWSGLSIGPGSLDSARSDEKDFLLYMRGVANELHAFIRPVR